VSRLSEKVAIVTGASKGIGAAIATALGAAGALVAVNYSSDREGAERVAQVITKNNALRDAILTHPTLAEGLIPLFSSAAAAHKVVESRRAQTSAA
jgi:3-oxoacyl-[acyl-carrier protein] reductase